MKATLKGLKEQNIGLVLKKIRGNSYSSRIKISKTTKLAKSAVSALVKILIDKNIIYEDKKLESSFGKKPIKLNFNKNFKYILAINIERDSLITALTNLDGEIIYRIDENNYPGNSRNEILQCLFNSIDKILKNSKKILKKILVISIGSHGVVNPKTNIITNAPYLKEWSNINLVDIFNQKYKKAVILNNSINLGAIGEQWINYPKVKNLIYININHGVGAGIIIDNKIIKGNTGTTGEISYLPILLDNNYHELVENKLELGFYEKQVDIAGIVQMVKNNLGSSSIKKRRNINYEKICSLYNDLNNNSVKELIDEKIIKKLALGISSILATIDTELVIINGEIIKLGDSFLKKLKNEIYNISPFKTDIVKSKLSKDSHILGAIKEGINYTNDIMYNKFFSLME